MKRGQVTLELSLVIDFEDDGNKDRLTDCEVVYPVPAGRSAVFLTKPQMRELMKLLPDEVRVKLAEEAWEEASIEGAA